MKCLRCGAVIDLSKPACAACGQPLDADGDGLPDVIGKLVEEKARAAVEAERERVAREARDAARREGEEKARADLQNKRRSLTGTQALLESNVSARRPIAVFGSGVAILLLILATTLAGCSAGCLEPAVGRSLVAGRVFCPGACDGCRGPGRIFTWHESSGGYEGNVSAQVCHNASVDVDTMSWMQVSDDAPAVQPYRLTLWLNFLIDVPLALGLPLVVGPFAFGWLHRRGLESSSRTLTADLERLTREIAEAERRIGKVETDEPYR